MAKTSKAIQTILSHHRDEIYDLINDGASISELHEMVCKCIDEAKATGNQSADEAKVIFENCKRKNNYNLYLSTLMTYMTGIKVS